jgi:hypothetical protein
MEVWEEAVTKPMTRLLVFLDSVLQRNDGSTPIGDACVSPIPLPYIQPGQAGTKQVWESLVVSEYAANPIHH